MSLFCKEMLTAVMICDFQIVDFDVEKCDIILMNQLYDLEFRKIDLVLVRAGRPFKKMNSKLDSLDTCKQD